MTTTVRWIAGIILLLSLVGAVLAWLFNLPGQSAQGPWVPLTDDEQAVRDQLYRHVHTLSVDIGERHVQDYAGLTAAADYIDQSLLALGYTVTRQSYSVEGLSVDNVVAERRGRVTPDEIIIIGAHYDSLIGTVGANDNATGVAVMLTMARLLNAYDIGRTVRLVGFVNEEPPYFAGEHMGSYQYVKSLGDEVARVVAMYSLETMGYYSNAANSQRYPPGIDAFYPSQGNFIAFIVNLASRSLLRTSVDTFRAYSDMPSQGLMAPAQLIGVDWSDHRSFWQADIPALMITDTALFRYDYYHTREDTIDKVDFDQLTRVTTGLAPVFVEQLLAQTKTQNGLDKLEGNKND